MPRPLWTGALSFGLVNVPVQVLSAVRDLDVHFHQLHDEDLVRLETRRFCSEEDREVPFEEVVRGLELEPGRVITLTDEELDAAQPERTRTIDIQEFVELAEIDPIFFDHPYVLVPTGGEGAVRAYALLREVMAREGRVALGRFVLRSREYLAAIRAFGPTLGLTTLLFADEVRPADDVRRLVGAGEVDERELGLALDVIESMSAPFRHERYEDRHRGRLLEIIRSKEAGEAVELPAARSAPSAPPDLMAALEATLARVQADGAGAAGQGSRARIGEQRQAATSEPSRR